MVQLVKNPPTMRENWVLSLGWEDPLEKGKATHSSILAWRIPWGRKELHNTERLLLSQTKIVSSIGLNETALFSEDLPSVSVVKNLPAMQEKWGMPI